MFVLGSCWFRDRQEAIGLCKTPGYACKGVPCLGILPVQFTLSNIFGSRWFEVASSAMAAGDPSICHQVGYGR